MEQKDSRWHKKTVGGTKSQSVEQNESRWGIFEQSVPYHPGLTVQGCLEDIFAAYITHGTDRYLISLSLCWFTFHLNQDIYIWFWKNGMDYNDCI